MDIRLVFMGTPEFAVPSLQALVNVYSICGVITQPDRPAGRGRKMIPSAIKTAAGNLQLEIYQPIDPNSDQSLDKIRSWQPNIICVVAYGQILSPQLLNIPIHGCINLHASLLPRWRGASPINAAILAGDQETGVTVMKIGQGLDDGPILAQERTSIKTKETAGKLSSRLAALGAKLLVDTIPAYIRGDIIPQPQDPELVTYAKLLKKSDGELDFSQTADQLARKVRAFSPWPGTFTFWCEKRLIVHAARPTPVTSPGVGVFTSYEYMPAIGTSDGILVLDKIQLAGKKQMSGLEFLHGTPEWKNHD
jgi:methionyl-tRNA formyltransferase